MSAAPECIAGQVFYLADYQPLALEAWVDAFAVALGASRIPTILLWVALLGYRVGDLLNILGRDRAESFFATFENELLANADFHSRREAHGAIVEFIKTWYNVERRHSTLGYVSPVQYEQQLCQMARAARPTTTAIPMTTGRTLDRHEPASLAYHDDFSADKLLAEVIASARAAGECIQTHVGAKAEIKGDRSPATRFPPK